MSEYTLQRSVLIRATQPTVFRYFTDSEHFAAWWGKGSTIDPRPGGVVRIVYPNGAVASGEVIEIAPLERIVFSYGYEDPSMPIRPGGSRVIITLTPEGEAGTRVHLAHELPDAATRDQHVPGWRFQLALFANAVANEQHAGAATRIDEWFAAWNGAELPSLSENISLRDAYAYVQGREELSAQIVAARIHMPLTLARSGQPRHCQGSALCDWSASSADGVVRARGTNLFEFAADGCIRAVTGFWSA